MRTITLLAVLAVAAGVGGAGEAGGTAEAQALARLSIDRTAPLWISGRAFKPGERVKLVITADGPLVRRVTATRLGRFHLRLSVSIGRCESVVVQAFGSRGSRAMIDRTAPDCAPTDQS